MVALLWPLAAAHAANWLAFYVCAKSLDWDVLAPEAEALVDLTRTPVFVADVLTEYWTRALPVIILLSLFVTNQHLLTEGPHTGHLARTLLLGSVAADAAATAAQKLAYSYWFDACPVCVGALLTLLWGANLALDVYTLRQLRGDKRPDVRVGLLAAAPRVGQHLVLAFSGLTLTVVALLHHYDCDDRLTCRSADQMAVTTTLGLITVALVLVTGVNPSRLVFDTTWNQLVVFPVVIALWTADRSAYVRLSAPAETVCGFAGAVLLVVAVLASAEQALDTLPKQDKTLPLQRKALDYGYVIKKQNT